MKTSGSEKELFETIKKKLNEFKKKPKQLKRKI